jgi:hypothetical protein
MARFNPIEFYNRQSASGSKPLSVPAPRTRYRSPSAPPPSALAQGFGELSKFATRYFKEEADKSDREKMREILMAYMQGTPGEKKIIDLPESEIMEQYGKPAYEKVFSGTTDIFDAEEPAARVARAHVTADRAMPELDDEGRRFTQERLEGLAAARHVAGSGRLGQASEGMLNTLMLDTMKRERAKKDAKLARSQTMEDYIKREQHKAFAPQGEKRTKEYRNAISMGLIPGTKEFNDYMIRATKITRDEPNPLLTKHAEGLAKTFDDWGKKGRNAPGFLAKLGDLRGVLSSGVDQGFGQKFLNNAARLAKRMGWKIDMQNLTGAQVAGSLINQLVVPRVKDLGAKPTDKDLQFIIDLFPQIQNEAGANELILQVLEIDAKRNIARAGFVSKWLKESAKTDRYGLDFQANLQAFENSNDIFKQFVPPGWAKQKSSSNKKLPPVPPGFG